MKYPNIFTYINFGTILHSFSSLFTFTQAVRADLGIGNIDFSKDHINLTDIAKDKSNLQLVLSGVKNNHNIGHITWGKLPSDNESLDIVAEIEAIVLENNKGYKRHPNDFIHGMLSSYVYSDNVVGNSVQFNKDEVNSKYNEYIKEWSVLQVFDKKESGRYYSVLYINEQQKQLVLAHRGTTAELADILKPDSPIKTDIRGVLRNEIVQQQIESYIATKFAVDYAKEQNYHLSITGHSLGAWLAELSSFFCHTEDFKYYNVKAVTFDSPGSKNMIDKFKSNVHDPRTNFNPALKLDVVSYLSAPNIVNSCNEHLGKVYTVSPKIPVPELISKYLPYIKDIPGISENLFMLNGLLTVSGHSLDLIMQEFNPDTGKPNNCKRVLDWPKIKYESTEVIGNSISKQLINLIPTGKLSGFALNILSNFIKKTISDDTCITAIMQTIHDFTKGNIKATQYWEVFKSINGSVASVLGFCFLPSSIRL